MKEARQTTGTAKRASAKATAKVSASTSKTRTVEPLDIGEPLLYTIRQAAAKLGMSYPTVERLIARGEMFSVKAEGKRLIPAWATVAYMRDLCAAHDPAGRYAAEYSLTA